MGITVMEIGLLVVSAICFVISFILPEGKEKTSGVDEELAQEEIRGLIRQEVDAIRNHVEDVVEESMTYAMEKTERSLERLSNEKIMAVNEYSDTVMQEIHKNHEEVMFLYDMLNTKHDTLKKTVTEASKAAKVMQDTVESIQAFRPVEVSYGEGSVKIAPVASRIQPKSEEPEKTVSSKEGKSPQKTKDVLTTKKVPEDETAGEETAVNGLITGDTPGVVPGENGEPGNQEPILKGEGLTEIRLGEDAARNSNERILELHKQGKSNVAIARELGLGVGEVKLVIDLFKNL